ncbi:MAG: TetR/AcrR family transcriptional regulator [Pseudomonadota bacterium]
MAHTQASERVRAKRRKDARPSEILQAAMAEFAAHGFADTSLGAIAARAGIARATIYLYFDSKDALFDALVRERLTASLEEMGASLESYSGSTESLLAALLKRLHDDTGEAEMVALLRILVTEGRRFPALVRLHHDRITNVGLKLLQRIAERGVARGEFAADILDMDLRVLIAPAMMGLFWNMVFAPVAPIDREALFRSHLRILMDGLRERG